MFDVLSCFEGSVNCNWKWFYQKYFPLGLQLGKYFHWASCSYLEILWIGILINRTVPLTSLLTLCILECVYAPLTLRVTLHLIKNEISQGSLELPQWSKLQWNHLNPCHIIQLPVEELCSPSRPDRRVSQLQLQQERRGGGNDDTSNCWHWTLNSRVSIACQCNVEKLLGWSLSPTPRCFY